MKKLIQLERLKITKQCARDLQRAFTLTELLAVLAAIALLVVVALPAFAGATVKGGRALCAANLRQMLAASMVYTDEYNTKLPPWRAGSGSRQDDMTMGSYSRYVYSGIAGAKAPMGFPAPFGCSYQNQGYLYGAKLAGDGNMFFCPAYISGPYSATYYSPLFTSDSGGVVRSSYNYNPRMINAGPPETTDPNVDTHRRYQKTTQLEPHKVFGVDVITGAYAHMADQGCNVVFTDGSVKFCKVNVPQIVQSSYGNLWTLAQTDSNYTARELLFNVFEGM